MRASLTFKIVATILFAVIISCAAVLCATVYLMQKPIDEDLTANIRKMQNVIASANQRTAERFAQNALLISHQDDLAGAVQEKDHNRVMAVSQKAMRETGSDFMTVTDDKGNVVGRGHSKKTGDSVLNQETVVKALSGTPAAAIVAGTVVPFTIRASQPIVRDNKVTGTLSIGASLVSPDYLDWLKEMSGMEIAIYKGDNRVMTTLTKDGKRSVDVKIENPRIAEAVLNNGRTIFVRDKVDGVDFQSAYWPMRAADGRIAGIWFVGMPVKNLAELETKAIWNAILISLGIAAVMAALAGFVGYRLGAPARAITNYVMAVDRGDKSAELDINTRDDMGRLASALRAMVTKQNDLLKENDARAAAADKKAEEAEKLEREARKAREEAALARETGTRAAADQIESVVHHINSAIKSLSQRVYESDDAMGQAASRLASTATAMEEMNSTVLEVAKNVGLAAEISASTRTRAEDGATIINQSIAGIQEVHQQSLSLKKDMAALDEHARSIDKIMGVISDIADQTNLLALNAAIEAARAGEAGRGFAVVADEVRKLAEKTMASTTEVGGAIQAIQHSADQSALQVEMAVRNIAKANEYSNKSGEALREILAMVEHTADEVRSIAAASEEQSAASEEITRSITEVNEITAATSTSMRDVASGLDALKQNSDALAALVQKMKS